MLMEGASGLVQTAIQELGNRAVSVQPKIAGFPDFNFVPTESGLTYWSSNQPSDSDVIRVVGLQGSEPENRSIAYLE